MKNLYRKIFWVEAQSLFLAVFLPVFILGLITGVFFIRTLKQEIYESFDARSHHFSNHLSEITQTVEELYHTLANSPTIAPSLKEMVLKASHGGLAENEQDIFNGMLDLLFDSSQKNPYVASTYIYYDGGGDYYISSSERLALLSESDDISWLETYQKSDPKVRAWTENRTLTRKDGQSQEVLTVYSRIDAGDDSGISCGILILNIDYSPLEAILERWYSQSRTIVMLTSENGRILINGPSAVSTLSVPPSELGHTVRSLFDSDWQQDQAENRKLYLNNTRYICMSQKLSRFGWHLLFLTSINDMYAPANRMRFQLIFIILLTLLLGTIFAAHTARQKVRDIARIHDSIQRAKDGQSASAARSNISVYSQALRELIDTFLNTDYLAVQLADRQHRAQLLELKALQSQLNPHFLFNTLTTIQWKAIGLTGGQNDASNMIEYLSDILRYSLDDSSRLATIREELAILDSYAAIQQIRYGERLHYSCQCAPDLTKLYVIRMLLQPLVENSISHGMSENKGCLNVSVQITKEQEHLLIRISDNGAGIDEPLLREIRSSLADPSEERCRHIGLYNVSKRLILTYGEDAHLNIDSTPGSGTVITFRLPLIDSDSSLKVVSDRS